MEAKKEAQSNLLFTQTPKPNASCSSQAALDHSLPIKRREAGLQTLVLWGRLQARNGKVSTAGVSTPRSSCCVVEAFQQIKLYLVLGAVNGSL